MSRYPLGHNSAAGCLCRRASRYVWLSFARCSAAAHAVKCTGAEYKQVCLQQQQQCVSFEAEHQADTDPLLHHWVYQLPSTTG